MGNDALSLGIGPIYETLTSSDYRSTDYFTTIFHFVDRFNALNAASSADVNALVSAQSIDGSGVEGTGETNSGSIANALPLYKTIGGTGGSLDITSVNDAGTNNKLGVRTFIEFTPSGTGIFTLELERRTGTFTLDPDFVVYQAGNIVQVAESGNANVESWSGTLIGGTTYIIDAYEYNNVAGTSGDYNLTFRISN